MGDLWIMSYFEQWVTLNYGQLWIMGDFESMVTLSNGELGIMGDFGAVGTEKKTDMHTQTNRHKNTKTQAVFCLWASRLIQWKYAEKCDWKKNTF